jgi:AhpD family alkylhydroperoxidase
MKNNFDKKIFTPGLFLNDSGFLLLRIPPIISALRNKQISKAFIEKIMTVTTAVNGCTYCTWFHAKQALASGISEEEVKNMLNLQFQADASDFETMALLYAQHYAETNRKPEEEMTLKFLISTVKRRRVIFIYSFALSISGTYMETPGMLF